MFSIAVPNKKKLPLHLKRRWVAALRSGKFKQGPDYLCQVNQETGEKKHCCLGVLAMVMGAEEKSIHRRTCNNVLINTVLSPDLRQYLAEANDDEVSFKQIARAIEKAEL